MQRFEGGKMSFTGPAATLLYCSTITTLTTKTATLQHAQYEPLELPKPLDPTHET